LFEGAVKEISADPYAALPETFCGGPGSPLGVIVPGLAEGPVPAALLAATLHV
jgi:hypothetical protein